MISVYPDNRLIHKDKIYKCAIGKKGITMNKSEGDHASPAGRFQLVSGFYRPDRLEKPQSSLNFSALKESDGWCDDPLSKFYNQYVELPFEAGHEVLWRSDCIYDIIITLNHNTNPAVPQKGSAIFFHLAHEDYRPTEGCVALQLPDMLEVLKTCKSGDPIEFIL